MVLMIMIVSIVMADLSIKRFVHQTMAVGEKRQCRWKRLFIWHIKNRGVAYNRLEGQRVSILLMTGGTICYFLKNMVGKWKKEGFSLAVFSAVCLLGGALGNFMERIKKGYVTDYIYIKAKGMPIFNLADVFILLGTVIYYLSSVLDKEKV